MKNRLNLLVTIFIPCLLFCVPNSVMAVAGDIDPTYGIGGRVATDYSRSDAIRDAAVQPDGKVVVVGTFTISAEQRLIARYKLNGSLDSAFGTDGRVISPFGLDADAVIIQPDGKIVAGGTIDGIFGLIRLNPNGSLDTSFGNAGKATIRFLPGITGERIHDIALQPDGKIVAVGEVDTSQWFAVARFNSNGSPDNTFGDEGRVRPGMGSSFEQANAVVIQSDLKIVAAGAVLNDGTGIDFALARFHPNGQLDITFGNGGRSFTDFNNLGDFINSLVLQPDGKLLAAGDTYQPFGTDHEKIDFGLARFDTDGNRDLSFEGDGRVVTGFYGNADLQEIVLQPDGKIVAAGSAFTAPGGNRDLTLVRYDFDGYVDQTFGAQGTVVSDLGGEDFISTVVLQPDNKIVAAGSNFNLSSNNGDFALARYLSAPTNAPVLQLQEISTNAVALDSVTFVRDPFPVTTEHNFSSDHQTRITLLATNLTLSNQETLASVSVQAAAAGGGIHTLPVEYVGEVPGFEWLTQVVVRLPPQLAGAGALQVSITHGSTSNQGSVVIN